MSASGRSGSLDIFAILCYAVFSVPCSLVVTSWERADLLALLCFLVFLSLSQLVFRPGQLWYLIVLIPDLYLPLYFQK